VAEAGEQRPCIGRVASVGLVWRQRR
jgi:hypothetical protein